MLLALRDFAVYLLLCEQESHATHEQAAKPQPTTPRENHSQPKWEHCGKVVQRSS
jgi:hypothetical protein